MNNRVIITYLLVLAHFVGSDLHSGYLKLLMRFVNSIINLMYTLIIRKYDFFHSVFGFS